MASGSSGSDAAKVDAASMADAAGSSVKDSKSCEPPLKVSRTTVVPAGRSTIASCVSWKFDHTPVRGVFTVTVSTLPPVVKVAVTERFGPVASPSAIDRLKA